MQGQGVSAPCLSILDDIINRIGVNMNNQNNNKVALFTPNNLFDPTLGRLEKGYTIVSSDTASQWIKISKKVREASPQEVASYFGG